MSFNKPKLQKSSHWKQGRFESVFKPQKYYGRYPIIYRSKWEFNYMISLERNPNVVKWSSEEIVIPYIMQEKVNGKVVMKKHNYHTDFTVHMKSGQIYVIEIKPKSQAPRFKNQIKTDPVAYKNMCKWNAALNFCKQNGFIFKVLTEEHLTTN